MLRIALKCGLALALLLTAGLASPSGALAESTLSEGQVVVKLQTTLGDIDIALNPDKAPETVKNFLTYVDEGFYNGTIFHRIVPGFVIQGGGLDANMREKDTRPPIENEAGNKLSNDRYTVAMARTSDPHSATAQFYINLVDNKALNYTSSTPDGFGYAVFGKVISGQDVVNKIAGVKTNQSVPLEPVLIIKTTRVN